MQISEKQMSAFRAICDVIIPSVEVENDIDGYWKRKASDLKVPEQIVQLVATLSNEEQKEFIQLLVLLSVPMLGLTWGGPLKGASNLTSEQLQKMLQRWSHSLVPDLRTAFSKLKKLCGLYYFGHSSKDNNNPNWAAMQYPGPISGDTPVQDSELNIKIVTNEQTLIYDIVVVGSGAGGGLVAAELAAAGKHVLVIEKGPYLQEHQYSQREVEMLQKLYDSKGLLMSKDGGTMFLAGSCLGGGTTVNWAGSLRTPDYVLDEWAREHENPHFADANYLKGFDAVEQRLGVNTDIKHNFQNQSLRRGAENLGYKIDQIPQNLFNALHVEPASFWDAQGFSSLGDVHGSKQSSVKTYLKDACKNGAEILPNTEVESVLVENGAAVGVIASVTKGSKKIEITIRAAKVIVSAGSIHTPALLMRSGLRHQEIGKNLFIHPTVPFSALYPSPVKAWLGPMMTEVCHEFSQFTNNFGFKLETPPIHPGLMAVATSWESGEKYKQEMLNASNFGAMVVLVRDKFGGSVKLNSYKRPEIHYKINAFDKKHLIKGMQEAAKIHRAAGAERLSIPHNSPHIFNLKDAQDIDFQGFLKKIEHQKWETNHYTLYTAHQMGTARMGGSNKRHPVKPTGETREVKNLFVADGSLFPSASGVNPMLSIQALAYHVAQEVKATL